MQDFLIVSEPLQNCNRFNSTLALTRSDSELRLPSLTEALDLLENCLSWPPPIRKAAISLWCHEAGMHPTEVWDVARAWLGEVSL